MIRSKRGLYLAIPTALAGKLGHGIGGGREKITPQGFERRTGLKLRFVYRRGAPSLLVVDDVRITKGGRVVANMRRRKGVVSPRKSGGSALNLSRKPRWLELGHGVRVFVEPLTSAVMMAARSELREALPYPGLEHIREAAAVALVKAIARIGIRDWEGVGDADGAPVPPTPERIDALLDLPPLYDAFERDHVGPALLLDAEKNAFAPSPNGTSAGASGTVPPAPSAAPSVPTT